MDTSRRVCRVPYVVGFAFYQGRVLLIRKNRPAWQAGKLNGVGGHVDPGETPARAMTREFFEEALPNPVVMDVWQHFATLVTPVSRVWMFAVELGFRHAKSVQARTDERLVWVDAAALDPDVVQNLWWLVPMARQALAGHFARPARVTNAFEG